MPKVPYFPFFPSDWLGDSRIRSLTNEERGVWMDLRSHLHQMDKRGILILGGEVLSDSRLSGMLCLLEQNLKQMLSKWLSLGLLQRDPENGAIYSQEVVETERIRELRSIVGKKGGESRLLKQNSSKSSGKSLSKPMEYGNGSGTGDGTDSFPRDGEFEGKEKKHEQARDVLKFLNEVAHRVFRETPTTLALIDARLAEVRGDVDGVKQMISRTVARWKGTEYEEYLQPSTLFSVKKFGERYDLREMPVATNGKKPPESKELQEKIQVKLL